MAEFNTFKEIPEDKLAEYKDKNYYVAAIPIEEDSIEGPQAKFIIKPMSVAQTNALAEYASKKGTAMASIQKTLIANTVVAGDMEHLDESLEDSRIRISLLEQIGEMQAKKKGTLSRL